jgi:argininosuccinate lyase
MKIWEKGFSVNDKIERFTVGQDRELDMYLAPFDMLASKAQAKMLASIGLISSQEESQLLTGLDSC